MPQEVILLKLGEIALKGLNRKAFEDVLLKNIRRRLQDAGDFSVSSRQSTIYVEPKDSAADLDLAEERVSKVFGVVGYARGGCVRKRSRCHLSAGGGVLVRRAGNRFYL